MSATHYDDDYFASHYGHVIGRDRAYRLLSGYWRRAVFGPLRDLGALDAGRVLDYGCGTGVVTAALPDCAAYDAAEFARDFVRKEGRRVFDRESDIPRGAFDLVLCSHSLEHYLAPHEALLRFRDYVTPEGHVLLLLPMEQTGKPVLTPDSHQHFYCWNFQTITNLLLRTGWKPVRAAAVQAPFMLNTLGRFLSMDMAVALALRLGAIRRACPSLMILARRQPGEPGPA